MEFTYRPKGVCSQLMEIETDGGVIKNVKVLGGCSGNSQGLASLLRGMDVDEAIARLEGIRCGRKDTSCPDQLSKALRMMRDAK